MTETDTSKEADMTETATMLAVEAVGKWEFVRWEFEDETWWTWNEFGTKRDSEGDMFRSLEEALISAVAHLYLEDGTDAWGQACSFARMIGMHVWDRYTDEWVWQPPRGV